MSRCKKCNRTFAEENGWQEFCSLQCAQKYIVGKTLDELDQRKKRDIDSLNAWHEWISKPSNARRVRCRENPEPAQKFGKFENRIVEWTDKKGNKFRKTIRVNVGSEVTIRPMTDEERASAERYRGHGFSDGHARNPRCDDLPSAHGLVGMGWYPHD